MTFSALLTGTSAGMLVYGSLVESNRLIIKRKSLYLKDWPTYLSGFRLALISDLHVGTIYTAKLVRAATKIIIHENPDMLVIAGDFVSHWKEDSRRLLHQALEPLTDFKDKIVAIPGNHDYLGHDPALLDQVCKDFGIKLLRNQNWHHHGVNWVGIDSICVNRSDPFSAMMQVQNTDPIIALWHEPDLVSWLPKGAALMLSGHTHGGQFIFPGHITPASTKFGRLYKKGLFPNAPTPLYVTSGVGTTGPPSRFLCPPEIIFLSLFNVEERPNPTFI